MNQPVKPVLQTFNPATLGSNPWDSQVANDSMAQQTQTQSAQDTMSGLNGQISAMGGTPPGGDSSAYPAMQNAYGLGSSPTVSGAGTGSDGGSAINIAMPDSSTRGANPWSFQGESNARGGGPPPTTPLSTQG